MAWNYDFDPPIYWPIHLDGDLSGSSQSGGILQSEPWHLVFLHASLTTRLTTGVSFL